MDEIHVIRTFRNHIDAELARSALESAGIESIIRADDGGGTYPFISGVELVVRAEDVARAEEVLEPRPLPAERLEE